MAEPFLPAGASLEDARAWLRAQLDEGADCPCCTQFAKVYRRKLTATAARTIIVMWREARSAPVHLPKLLQEHLPDIAHQGGYATLGVHWGLIADAELERPDGAAGRAGWWRVTEDGAAWIAGTITVAGYARLYDGRCLGLTGPPVGIRDALGTHFNLEELMANV